jgi:MFS transporter, DHA1 family, multidrug resistance protein
VNTHHPSRIQALVAIALLAVATSLGLAGTDLVLPAVPMLPQQLGGSAVHAQYVLAAYVMGAGLGLLLFGSLGARSNQGRLLVLSLLSLSLLSWAITAADTLSHVTALRFLQGVSGSAAAVFAPGMIRALYDETTAVRVIGILGSIESLVPALAPLAGLWLFNHYGWTASFQVTGGIALVLALIAAVGARSLWPASVVRNSSPPSGGYGQLLRNAVFMRYALSQAFCLGGLLIFVFGAPVVIVGSLHGTLADFVTMQVSGIVFFIVGANLTGSLVRRFGVEQMIFAGTGLSAAGALALLSYGLVGGSDPLMVAVLFVPMNLGLGLRGPPGFYQAVLAAGADSARGAALVILAVQITAAAGTVLAAEWIVDGLVPLTVVAAVTSVIAVLVLMALPPAMLQLPETKREA